MDELGRLMHPAVFQTFEEILRSYAVHGDVMEIGATPDDSTLLNLPALAAARKKIGINKVGASRHNDFSILEADANAMTCFPEQSFDAVLCNAVLEHDPFFWKTLAEITVRSWLARLPRSSRRPDGWAIQHSTLTLGVHNFPGDYYRFSEQAVREVFFAGAENVVIRSVLVPPRIIGAGIRP